MSTAELYGKATRSSRLKMEDHRAGDVDLLTAAGFSNSLGTLLLRVLDEYDRVRKRHIADEKRSVQDRHAHMVKVKAIADEEGKEKEREELERDLKEIDRRSVSDGVFVLIELKSLMPAKQALGRWAWNLVEERKLNLTVDEVQRLTQAVLMAWLDRLCDKCDGRGFTGGYRGPTIRCTHCRETGNRRESLFSEKTQMQLLANKLLCEMDRVIESATRKMTRLSK